MRWIFLLSVAGLLTIVGFFPKFWNSVTQDPGSNGIVTSPPELQRTYAQECAALEAKRIKLATTYESASDESRNAILTGARSVLEESLFEKLAPHWMGTPWDFNGTSQTPGEGKIACGYFVSTLLRDAGFELERIRLAQQASGNIIRSLTTRENTSRLVGKSFDDFVTELEARGPGVYVIGLDYHVGFIVQTADGARFVHSDGMENKCVVSEPAKTAPVLKRSNWREFANITGDEALIEKWLTGEAVVTRKGS